MSFVEDTPVISFYSYQRYIHCIKTAYRLILDADCTALLPSFSDLNGGAEENYIILHDSIVNRISNFDKNLADNFLDKPYLEYLCFGNHQLLIPISNVEGRSWYSGVELMNFDFLSETYIGMHRDARVIFDIGGHQGVFALYYSKMIPRTGRVYTFEPSLINIEIAAMSFLMNEADNIVLVPMGVGPNNETIMSTSNGLLVAGSPTKVTLIRPDWVILEKPDFIKIDIEGFEHELICTMPWLFDICKNIHLEIHVPHLNDRGINYREIYDRIPFDRFRVRLASWGRLTDLDPTTELDGFSTLLLTPKQHNSHSA